MTTYYLAIDLGASSGRLILGWLDNGRIRLEEVHRFPNGMVEKDGRRVWEVDRLFNEIRTGMRRCRDSGRKPSYIGIDTWGVDFVLLDKDDRLLGDAVGYRDTRTQGMDDAVFDIIPELDLYARTGIQRWIFNSIYQLYAIKKQQPEHMDRATSFLMLPEYFGFLLTGRKMNEYCNATTSQLVGATSRDWDWELIDKLGLPKRIFGTIHKPGTALGTLRPEIAEEVGFDAEVILPPTHDTASAVMAMPAEGDDAIYINSGTWSLMGIELAAPNCTPAACQAMFTNEGGYDYRYRFLKNIMGMWIVQSVRKEMPGDPSFDRIIELAREGEDFASFINVNDDAFFAPESMSEAIRRHCRDTGQAVPGCEAHLLACAYKSLARSYADTVREIEELTGKTYSRIHIMGGGSRDDYMNRLAARYTGKDVYAGPVEATALGNVLTQMIRHGVYADLDEARRAVRNTFSVTKVDE